MCPACYIVNRLCPVGGTGHSGRATHGRHYRLWLAGNSGSSRRSPRGGHGKSCRQLSFFGNLAVGKNCDKGTTYRRISCRIRDNADIPDENMEIEVFIRANNWVVLISNIGVLSQIPEVRADRLRVAIIGGMENVKIFH